MTIVPDRLLIPAGNVRHQPGQPVQGTLMPVIGIDVVVFGIALMMSLEAALLTPPVGLNLFMVKAITGDELWPIVKGNLPFAALLLFVAIILFIFPEMHYGYQVS